MKKLFIVAVITLIAINVNAQKYPVPEFSNEVYLMRKDSALTLTRLEKSVSNMETKTKMGGMAGAESGYEIEGERSSVRFPGGNISFIFYTGQGSVKVSASDSLLRANGLDPASMRSMGDGQDPGHSISLYKVELSKGKRKIWTMKSGGAFSKKAKSTDKISYSVRKLADGYYELVIDKPLQRGEYAFAYMDPKNITGMSMPATLFSFAIE